METTQPTDLQEPAIASDELLKIVDPAFHPEHVCIVTGVGTGIGRATAIAAAANRLTVVGLDVNADEGARTVAMAEQLGGKMVFLPTDLTDDAQVHASVEKAAQQGHIRYLINIAGVQHIDAVEAFPMAKYDLMQRLMLRAPFLLSQLTIPHMRRTADGCGVIAHMASVHAHICTANKPVYNITKFGLRALAQSISAEGQGRIRSFTVSTGFVRTPLALKQIPDQARQRGISEQEVVEQVMMGKSRVKAMMKPVEVANLFIFGISRHGGYLVGGDLLFDGGMVLTY
ncbi:MAG: D-beta-hydroxybutyrate dehydrogenase [Desulfatitalea sp. BRH_c12]|nr:MAG: D-beta-hydroxybutyrate dehydrogenase [Desulfatitalea sp. BRH_c12]